jgi:hypothetical protein
MFNVLDLCTCTPRLKWFLKTIIANYYIDCYSWTQTFLCSFSAKHNVLKSTNKDGLDRSHDIRLEGHVYLVDCCVSELAL